jgi:hypothetical protein
MDSILPANCLQQQQRMLQRSGSPSSAGSMDSILQEQHSSEAALSGRRYNRDQKLHGVNPADERMNQSKHSGSPSFAGSMGSILQDEGDCNRKQQAVMR